MHTSTLRAAGGSIALTIPQPLARLLSLHAGEAVTLEAEGGRLVVAPQRRKRYTASDLVAMQGKAPLLVDAEWDAMPATGTEAAL
ncbi:AbrB/MazE/SpoVT family DNA-binding domain-containing protein [Hydrogenophaga soli]